MRGAVSEVNPALELWRLTLADLTRHETFTKLVSYTSSRATAEWIEETPVTLDSSQAGTAPLPELTRIEFSDASIDGHAALFHPAERVLLRAGSRARGSPSLPQERGRGFAACSWTDRCSAQAR
jgi:hypothetical protein